MTPQETQSATFGECGDSDAVRQTYIPPRLVRLGSLAELTLGGSNGPDDGFGGAGDEGSV